MTQARAKKSTMIRKKIGPLPKDLEREVTVGKDILELLTTGMYVDPLTIYREYTQNAVDAIDEAVKIGQFDSSRAGFVRINIDGVGRRITIRDNGLGIPNGEFEERLTSLGASKKRGNGFRGFRGVGRLCGLAYCQTLAFRSKGPKDDVIRELTWDCRTLKKILRSNDFSGDLADVVRNVTSLATLGAEPEQGAFFEVELDKVVRLKNDILLNEGEIKNYLSQIAPLPFRPDFSFGERIDAFLQQHFPRRSYNLYLGDSAEPLEKPFTDEFSVTENKKDQISEAQFFETTSIDGSLATVGWILHHGYVGSIQQQPELKGLRARCGDMQVGSHDIFQSIFREARFSSWTMGEIHILDDRIIPNGRRDSFEQDAHFYNLLNQLAPLGREVARRCRSSSMARNALKTFRIEEQKVRDRFEELKQGAVSKTAIRALHKQIGSSLREMEQVSNSNRILPEIRPELRNTISTVKRQARRLENKRPAKDPLGSLPASKRRIYQEMFDLIYECSVNRQAAKSMIDRILARIEFLR